MNRILLLVLLGLLPSMAARADRLLIWGIQDRCEQIPELDRALDHQFHEAGLDTWLLSPQPSACQGADCARRLQSQCGAAAGRVLGGRVYRGKSVTRLRLWLHDLGTRQTAFLDAYCQDCNLSTLVPQQANYLLQNPQFGAAPGSIPQFCQNQPRGGSASRSGNGPVHLTVYGEARPRHAAVEALRQALVESARTVHAVPKDAKEYGHAELLRLVGPGRDGQVLGVELLKEGGATMWLFDGKTEKTHTVTVDCASCESTELTDRLKNNLGGLLGHCFANDCARGDAEPPPAAACEPLQEPSCKEDPLAVVPSSTGGSSIDPTLAKLVKGGLWSLFAASAATTIGLAIANETGAGGLVTADYESRYTLTRPAWAMASVAVVSLGLAIPTTILVNRAQRASGAPAEQPKAASTAIRCPN